jgi:hypothetical protein
MATINQIRGALLEEAVLFLLKNVGYESVDVGRLASQPVEGMRAGHSGLEVRGPGTWHQLDALALWGHSPAFMYPLQLIVEAKCYTSHRPVGVEVPRNVVGVIKDISESYFTLRGRKHTFQTPRYNYAAAIFSTSKYSKGAVEYAIAHQIFLIQYDSVPAIQPLIDAIFLFDENHIATKGRNAIAAARSYFRARLAGEDRNSSDAAPPNRTGKGSLGRLNLRGMPEYSRVVFRDASGSLAHAFAETRSASESSVSRRYCSMYGRRKPPRGVEVCANRHPAQR